MPRAWAAAITGAILRASSAQRLLAVGHQCRSHMSQMMIAVSLAEMSLNRLTSFQSPLPLKASTRVRRLKRSLSLLSALFAGCGGGASVRPTTASNRTNRPMRPPARKTRRQPDRQSGLKGAVIELLQILDLKGFNLDELLPVLLDDFFHRGLD